MAPGGRRFSSRACEIGSAVLDGVTELADEAVFLHVLVELVGARVDLMLVGGADEERRHGLLGGGRAGHTVPAFDQTTQCPYPTYAGVAIDAAPLVGVSWGYGGNVWVR